MKLPKNEKIYLTLVNGKDVYVITSNPVNREVYFLYREVQKGNYEKLSSSNNPLKLEKKVFNT